MNWIAILHRPQHLAVIRIDREKRALMIGAEDHTAGCGDDAGPARPLVRHIPLLIAGGRIDGAQRSPARRIQQRRHLAAHRPVTDVRLGRRPPDKASAGFADRQEKRVRQGIERWRHEVRAAVPIGTRRRAGLSRIVSRDDNWTAVAANFFRPIRVHVRFAVNHFPGRAIEHVKESVAVRLHDNLAHLTRDSQIGEHRHLVGVPVVRIMRRELVVPLQRAGIRVEREQ